MRLVVVRGGSEIGVQAYVPIPDSERTNPNKHSRMVNISDEIPELARRGEAVAVFDRLWGENYIDVKLGVMPIFAKSLKISAVCAEKD